MSRYLPGQHRQEASLSALVCDASVDKENSLVTCGGAPVLEPFGLRCENKIIMTTVSLENVANVKGM